MSNQALDLVPAIVCHLPSTLGELPRPLSKCLVAVSFSFVFYDVFTHVRLDDAYDLYVMIFVRLKKGWEWVLMRSVGGGMLLFLSSDFGLETHGSVGCLSLGHDFMMELVNTTLEEYHQCMPELSGA